MGAMGAWLLSLNWGRTLSSSVVDETGRLGGAWTRMHWASEAYALSRELHPICGRLRTL